MLFVFSCIQSFNTLYAQEIKFKSNEYVEINTALEIKGMTPLSAYSNSLKVTTIPEWETDMIVSDAWRTNYKFKQAISYVKAGIDQSNLKNNIDNYKYEIHLKVVGYLKGTDTTSKVTIPVSLILEYNKDSLQSYQHQNIVRFSKDKIYKFRTELVNIYDISSGTPITVSKTSLAENFYIETGILTQKIDLKDYNARILRAGSNYLSESKELDVFWNHHSGGTCPTRLSEDKYNPAMYELEWTYVDDYRYNINTKTKSFAFTPSSYNISYSFINNATRIQTNNLSFKIPIIYEHGAIVFRVRAIFPDSLNYSNIRYGSWTLSDIGTISQSTSGCASGRVYIINNPHQSDSINWQYSINFAEEGKYKHVISYFDGVGKNRQTQTKIQTDNNYVIGVENIFDYEGRAAIKTLPIPIYSPNINYKSNVALASSTGTSYNASKFDVGCTNDSIEPLHSSSLAYIYYSSANPDKGNMQKFVPDAGGYPFIETIYSSDNTNKVIWQGGAGKDFQRWKNTGTRFIYGRASSVELNSLLGSESGLNSYYPKQVTIDPNGQSSYSIFNNKGQVVATALVGSSPDSSKFPISQLTHFENATTITYDILKGLLQNINRNNRIAEHTFIAEAGSLNKLRYGVNIIPFNTGCASKFIHLKGIAEIKAINDCGSVIWQNSYVAGSNLVNTSSTAQNFTFPEASFTLTPDKYTIIKSLSFPDTMIYRVADDFVTANTGLSTTCYMNEDIFVQQSIESTEFPCDPNIKESECDIARKTMIKELYPGEKYGKYIADENGNFVEGVANSIFSEIALDGSSPGIYCKYDIITRVCTPVLGPHGEITLPCNGPCVDNIETIISDSVPSIDTTLSSFYCSKTISGPYDCVPTTSDYRYKNNCVGNNIIFIKSFLIQSDGSLMPVIQIKKLKHLTPQELIDNFNDEIAELLLPLHPEYCKLSGCDTGNFVSVFENITSYAEAEVLGYNSLSAILSKDPMNNSVKPGAPFTSTQLSNFPVTSPDLKPIDVFSLQMTYCGSNAKEATLYCIERQYSSQINAFVIPDSLQDLYFNNLKNNYLSSRSLRIQKLLDGSSDDCAPCSTARMGYMEPPVFPPLFNSSGTAISDDVIMPEWLKDIFNDAMDGSLSTGSAIPPGVLSQIDSMNMQNCEAQIEAIIRDLINCGLSSIQKDAVRTSLLQHCMPGTSGVLITPLHVKTLLDSLSISLNEMCHPFLAKYKIYDTRNKTLKQKYVPKDPAYYAGIEAFINRAEVKNALLNATVSGYNAGSIVINPTTNLFELGLSQNLLFSSGGGSVTVKGYVENISTSSGTQQYYKISLNNGTAASDTLFFAPRTVNHPHAFENSPSLIRNYVANTSPLKDTAATTTSISFNSTKNIIEDGASLGLNSGLISNNLVFTRLFKDRTVSMMNFYTYAFYSIWGHKISMMDTVNTDIPQDCITCPELLKALEDFELVDKVTYKYDNYINSPLYKRTLTNYLNYKWSRTHTYDEYAELMKGCAISDKIAVSKMRSSLMATFSSIANMNTFINNMNASLDSVRVPYYVFKKGSTFTVDFDMNGVPFDKYKIVKQYLNSTTGPSSRVYQPVLTHNVVLHLEGSAPLPSISGTTETSSDIQVVNMNGSLISGKEIIISTSSTDPKILADINQAVNDYIETTPSLNLIKIYRKHELLRSNDYSTVAKQQYLDYAYSLYGQHPFNIRNGLSFSALRTNVAALSPTTLKLSYEDPDCSIKNSLYYYNEIQSSFGGFDTLNRILNAVKSGIGGNKLFSVSSETTISTIGLGTGSYLKLKAFKQADGGMWYRFFNSSNKLKNVFLYPSDKMAYEPIEYSLVAGSIKLLGNTDSIYEFSVQMTKSGHTVTCRGFADFPIGIGDKLQSIVLYDHQGEVKCRNINTCESEKLEVAIEQGKEAYAIYRDSIVTALTNGMAMHFPKNSIDTLKHTTSKQQYHHTLYYYDLVGNLTRTVPPQGVNPLPLSKMDAVDNARDAGLLTEKATHGKVTSYRYNSANQVIWQQTPDGGTTRFYYDKAGRLAFSQNDKQKVDNKYSYTLYDQQGRLCETGVLSVDNLLDTAEYIVYSSNKLMAKGTSMGNWIFGRLREDVVATRYDYQLLNLHEIDEYEGLPEQQNLRKRVAAIMYATKVTGSENIENYYDYATHFTYDALGNVTTIIHDNPYMNYMKQRFKKVDYEYDLLSGKVNMLSYNRGYADQYYHKYEYDADNRITRVMTSNDGLLWDRDAEYEYYKHGPLAKVSMGSLNIQQTEYAYTIQGWLKAINGDALNPADDMGAGMNGIGMPADVMVHALDYYKDDYKPIGTTPVMHKSEGDALTRSLYNGNIARQTTGMVGMSNLQRDYSYDQLHRITKAQYSVYDNISHTITALGNAFRNTYSYDKDGNILTLTRRNQSGTLIDSFKYNYLSPTIKNQLSYVEDYITSSAGNDLKAGQAVNNYRYDPLGNLISDQQEGIKEINWNAYGKMTELYKRNAADEDTMSMKFSYDGMGYRVRKDYIQPLPDDKFQVLSDIYVRDASGNVLAVYKEKAILGGSNSIDWLIEDVVDGNGGWTVSLSSIYSPSRFLESIVGASGAFIEGMSTQPEILDPSWSSSLSDSKSTGFYLLYSPSIRSKASISVVEPALDIVFPYFTTTHLPLITDVLMSDSLGAMESLLSPFWNLQHNSGYANYNHLFTESPAVGDQLLEIFGHNPVGMSMQDKIFSANAIVSEHGFSHVWSRIVDELHPALDASGYLQAVLQDTTIFSTQALQQDQQMRQSIFTAFSYPREIYKSDFYNALGTWVTSTSPTFLAQYTSLPERLRAIYDSNRVSYIQDFGARFGTSEIASIIKGIPNLTVFRLRNLVQWAVGKTLTSTYDPPEVHDPSPENMVSDTLYLAEHHLYGSSRLGVKQYSEDMYYTVYDSDDTTLLKRRDWYSYLQDDWMQKNKAAAYIHDVYSVSLDSARSLNRIGTKQYELTDHLGNVVVTVLDRRTGIGNVGGLYTGWRADVQSVTDYYPFGMPMAERSVINGSYRFGFNGQEKVNEISGKGNHNTAQFWEYDSRIARRWNVDPKPNVSISQYAAFANNPLLFSDIHGDTVNISFRGGLFGLGKKVTVRYENGNLYNLDGSKYTGKISGFLKKTTKALSEIGNTEIGNALLTKLQKSTNKFNIEKSNNNRFEPFNLHKAQAKYLSTDPNEAGVYGYLREKGVDLSGGSGGTIYWNPNNAAMFEFGGGYVNRPNIALGHELFHGEDANDGNADPRAQQADGKITHSTQLTVTRNEWMAVYRENMLRMQMGIPLRTHYRKGYDQTSRKYFPLTPYMLTPSGQPILPTIK